MPAAKGEPVFTWLTQVDAAERLLVTDRTIRAMIANGDLPAYRLGKRMLRIRSTDVDNLLRRIPAAKDGNGMNARDHPAADLRAPQAADLTTGGFNRIPPLRENSVSAGGGRVA